MLNNEVNYKELYELVINQVLQARNVLVDAQLGTLEENSAITQVERMLRLSLNCHYGVFKEENK